MPGKEMSLDEAKEFLKQAEWGRLATYGPEGPYITPLHYELSDNKIYFHCAPRGRKLENIRREDRVCFEVSELIDIVEHKQPCKFTTRYRSVLVFGRATLVDDVNEKVSALNLFAAKYCKPGGCEPVTPDRVSSVSVIVMEIEKISGKVNLK